MKTGTSSSVAKKTKASMKKRISPFTKKPIFSRKKGLYVWADVEIKEDPIKGKGLFAKRDLEPGLLIPYGGIEVTGDYLSSNRKGNKNNKLDYILHLPSQNTFVDANPDFDTSIIKNSWIGSMVNEPSRNEFANAVLCDDISKELQNFSPPDYPNIHHNKVAYIKIDCDVAKGEEIMAIYGYSGKAHNRIGFEVGKHWTEQQSSSQGESDNIIIKPRYKHNRTIAQITATSKLSKSRKTINIWHRKKGVAKFRRSEKQQFASLKNLKIIN